MHYIRNVESTRTELLDIYILPRVLTIQENNPPLPNQAILPITRIEQAGGDVLVYAVRIIMDRSLSQHGNLSPSKCYLGPTRSTWVAPFFVSIRVCHIYIRSGEVPWKYVHKKFEASNFQVKYRYEKYSLTDTLPVRRSIQRHERYPVE